MIRKRTRRVWCYKSQIRRKKNFFLNYLNLEKRMVRKSKGPEPSQEVKIEGWP